jgi:hypothetical protein
MIRKEGRRYGSGGRNAVLNGEGQKRYREKKFGSLNLVTKFPSHLKNNDSGAQFLLTRKVVGL